jgi:ABC-2 type transport system ATP-binding protein
VTAAGARALGSTAIEIRGLTKRYGGRSVVDRLDLEVRAGELVALLGPNGAGKTTTVETIEGYRRPDAGSVRVLGRDPAGADRDLRARVGVMLQSGGIDPRARPLELLRLHAAFFADPRPPDELLTLAGLEAVARTPSRRLSGGERQRLSLALAIVGRPEVLLLDEPTAGMDPAARAATRELIASLRSDGATILLTTHDLVDVERLADRVAILVRGRLAALGTPAELTAGARSRLRLRLVRGEVAGGAAEEASGLARALGAAPADVQPDETLGAGGISIDGAATEPAAIARLAAWAAERNVLIAELRVGGASLEERYLELTADAPDRPTS